jgi:hypothetical protein
MTEQLEFVNDWSELEAAVSLMRETQEWYNSLEYYDQQDMNPEMAHALSVIVDYVPRLLTQYAKLVELSFALTEGWETYATLNAPSGLYLPDNS